MMSPRRIMLLIGLAGAVITLAWGAWNHIGKLNQKIGTLEAQYAQLEQQVAVMAQERERLDLVLAQREISKEGIKNAHNQDLATITEIIRTDETARDWSGDPLPDDFKRLLKRDSDNQPSASLLDGADSGA